MERIRIVMVDLPRMLRELVEQAIAAQPDMVVVEPSERAEDEARGLAAAAEAAGADVLILVASSGSELRGLDPALYRWPRLKVVGIAHDGRDTFLRELRPRTVAWGNVGPQELADAIRRTVRGEPAEC